MAIFKSTGKIPIGDFTLFPFMMTELGRKLQAVMKYLDRLQDSLDAHKKAGLADVASFSFTQFKTELMNVESSLSAALANFSTDTLSTYDFIEVKYEEVKDPETGAVYLKIEGAKLARELFNKERESLFENEPSLDNPSLLALTKSQNVLNILFNIEEIYSFAKPNFLMEWMAENLPEMKELANKEPVAPCDAGIYFLDRVYQILAEQLENVRGLNEKSLLLPVDWKEFIETYIKYPSPFFRTGEDPLNNPPHANKKSMSQSQWEKQKAYFTDTVQNPLSVRETFGIQHNKRQSTTFRPQDKVLTQQEVQKIKVAVRQAEGIRQKFGTMYTEILDKICLDLLIVKAVECTLPNLECAELIKEFGIKRILPLLPLIEGLDPKIRNARLDLERQRRTKNTRAIKFNRRAYAICSLPETRFGNNLNDFSISFGVQASANDNKAGMHIVSMYKASTDDRIFSIKTGRNKNLIATFHVDGSWDNRIEVTTSEIADTTRNDRNEFEDMLILNGKLNNVVISYIKGKVKVFTNGVEDLDAKVQVYGNENLWNEDTFLHTAGNVPLTIASTADKNKTFIGFVDDVVLFNESIGINNAKVMSSPEFVLTSYRDLKNKAAHYWRMGDDSKDKINKTDDRGSSYNRIYDQIGVSHLTPKRFTSQSSGIFDVKGMDDEMAQVLIDVLESNGYPLEKFCQLLMITLLNSLGAALDFQAFTLPDAKTINLSGDYWKQLQEIVAQIVVDLTLELVLYMLDSITVSCDGLKKALDGNFADTSLGRAMDSLGGLTSALASGDLTAVVNNPLGASVAQDVLGAAEKIAGEVSDSLSAYMNQNLPQEVLEAGYSPAIDDLLNTSEPTSQQAISEEFQSNWLSGDASEEVDGKKPSGKSKTTTKQDKKYATNAGVNDLMSAMGKSAVRIGISQFLKLMKGEASLESLLIILDILRENNYPMYNYFSSQPLALNEIFGMLGVLTGLDKAHDSILADLNEAAAAEPEAFLEGCFQSSDTSVDNRAQGLASLSGGDKEDFYDLAREQLEKEKARFRGLLDNLLNGQDTEEDPLDGKCEKTPYDSVPRPEILDKVYENVINVAVGGIQMAYDSDCVLYKPAIAEEQRIYKKVPKILWADESLSFTTVEAGQVVQKSGRLKDTIMNPEFKGMVSNGFIPLKKDGKPDGSEFGAVLKIKWSPAFSEGWLQKTERISLGLKADGETSKGGATVDDLPGALGPYTDYDEGNGGSPNALKPIGHIELAANVKKHLRKSIIDENYFSGRRTYNNRFKDYGTEQSRLLTEYNQKRAARRRLEADIEQKKRQRDKIRNSAFSGFLNAFTGELDKLISIISRLEATVLPRSIEQETEAKTKYEEATIRDVEVVGGYRDKSFYALEGRANETILSRAAKEAGYFDPVPALPTFEVINGNTFGSLINNTSSFQIKRFGKDKIDYYVTRENSMEEDLRHSPQMSNYVEEKCSIFDEEGGLAIEPHTSQENVFSHIISNKWYKLDSSEEFKESLKAELLNVQIDDTPETLSSTYDNIYQEVVKSMAKEVSKSPFLKTVAGTKSPETKRSLIGLHFVDINPTDDPNHILADLDPRLMDFKDFTTQFMRNLKFFEDCKVGEVNVDGRGSKDTNMVLAVLSIHAAMVARIYSIEFILQSLFPFFQLDMEMGDMIEKVILERIKGDMEKTEGYYQDFVERTIQIQNLMSEYGMIDEEPAETFEEAFTPILRREFEFVREKSRRVMMKECLPKLPEGVDEEKYEQLKNFLIDKTKIIDVKTDRYSNMPLRLSREKRKTLNSLRSQVEKYEKLAEIDPKRSVSNSVSYYSGKLKEMTEELELESVTEKVKKGGLYIERYIKDKNGNVLERVMNSPTDLDNVLHIFSPEAETFGVRLVYAKIADGVVKESSDGNTTSVDDLVTDNVKRASFVGDKTFVYRDTGFEQTNSGLPIVTNVIVHPLAQYEDSIDNLKDLLGIDLENPEKCEPAGFFNLEGESSSPVKSGKTIGFEGWVNHGNHIHKYKINPDGTGRTIKTIRIPGKGKKKEGVKDVLDHEHKIFPMKDNNGNIKSFTFRSSSIEAKRSGTKVRADTSHAHFVSVKEEETSNIPNQLTEHVLEQMRKTTDFRIMFEYCFNLQDISSMVAVYAYLANSTREALNMYNLTKERIESFFYASVNSGDYFSNTTCNQKAYADSLKNLGDFNLDSAGQLLLLLLTTPLYIYKGWSKTADPHVLVTQSLVELGQAGFLIPKIEDTKIEIPFTDPVQCETVPLPTYPGIKIDFPRFTQVTATAVTFAPMLVGAPPFLPTPFGLIYYLLVDPLLMLLTGKLGEISKEYGNGQEMIDSLAKAGLENILTDVPLCEEETRDDDAPPVEVPPEEIEQEDSCLPTQKSMELAAGKSKC